MLSRAEKPVKNLLGALACHSLSVFASWADCILLCVSLLVFASIKFSQQLFFIILLFSVSNVCLAKFLSTFVHILYFGFLALDLDHQCCVRFCITTFFYFLLCAPLPPSVLSFPPLSLSWFGKCFGLQRMMVNNEEVKGPYGLLNGSFRQPVLFANDSLGWTYFELWHQAGCAIKDALT